MYDPSDRKQVRAFFKTAWAKHIENVPAEPLEILIADVIQLHPEYQRLLEGSDDNLDKDYLAEDGQINPYLHLGMHITLREQIQTDRPVGIVALYNKLLLKTNDIHNTEHLLMDCLGECLWTAQRNQLPPNEQSYLDCVQHQYEKL